MLPKPLFPKLDDPPMDGTPYEPDGGRYDCVGGRYDPVGRYDTGGSAATRATKAVAIVCEIEVWRMIRKNIRYTYILLWVVLFLFLL